jgi:molybdopterin molybdotransferase
MISIEQALDLISSAVSELPTEGVSLANSVGRVLAETITADVDSPPHDKSVMDGFAVRAADITPGCQLRIVETITAGDLPQQTIYPGTAARIMTGAPLPTGADTVVMVEKTRVEHSDGSEHVTFEIDQIAAGQHTMQVGASFAKGTTIFEPPRLIGPLDIGLLAEVGKTWIEVRRRPTCGILPTGNELVEPHRVPAAGQIRNSNGPMLVALLQAAGAKTDYLGIGLDEPKRLSELIETGLSNDLLLLSGGVSEGLLDLAPKLLTQSGVRNVFHGVAIKPGKPIWFGVYEERDKKTYVFALPGNPVSSLVAVRLFVNAALRKMHGFALEESAMLPARLAGDHQSRGGRTTYWPGEWVSTPSCERVVQPLAWLGSSDLRTLASAKVLIIFPSEKSRYSNSDVVQVLPLD